MTSPNYPLSSDVNSGQPTSASHYNNLRADALRLGAGETDSIKLAALLSRYQSGVKVIYLATNRIRVPYVTSNPATLMINGYMCQALANVDLSPGMFSGGAATWYIFAVRTAGSTTFTLTVNTGATEAVDTRIIGDCYWDGANIINVRSYFTSPLDAADYDSGWFAVAYNNLYTKAHGLAQPPRLVIVWHAATAGGTGELVQLIVNAVTTTVKSAISVDAMNVYLNCQNDSSNGVIFASRRNSGSGYVRIHAWL